MILSGNWLGGFYMRKIKCLITNMFGLFALMFASYALAGYDIVNGGELVISDDFVDVKIYKSGQCNWRDPVKKDGYFDCKKDAYVSRDEVGQLLVVTFKNRCLFLMNGVVSTCPNNRSGLVIIKEIPGFKHEGVNFLSIVNYDHKNKKILEYASN